MDDPVIDPTQTQADLGTLNYVPQKPEVSPPIPESPKPAENISVPEVVSTITPTSQQPIEPPIPIPQTPVVDNSTISTIVNKTTDDQSTSSLQTSSDRLTRDADEAENKFIEEVGAAHGSE